MRSPRVWNTLPYVFCSHIRTSKYHEKKLGLRWARTVRYVDCTNERKWSAEANRIHSDDLSEWFWIRCGGNSCQIIGQPEFHSSDPVVLPRASQQIGAAQSTGAVHQSASRRIDFVLVELSWPFFNRVKSVRSVPNESDADLDLMTNLCRKYAPNRLAVNGVRIALVTLIGAITTDLRPSWNVMRSNYTKLRDKSRQWSGIITIDANRSTES